MRNTDYRVYLIEYFDELNEDFNELHARGSKISWRKFTKQAFELHQKGKNNAKANHKNS